MFPKKKIMLVFGTRPEAVKMAPLALALRKVEWCEPIIAVTAQHREMLDQVMELFGLTADYDLDMLTPGQTLTDVTTKALNGLGPIMESVKPDCVVVQGDTTTTFAGALAAFYRQIPVVHMEAGLRTDDPLSPFPEEINRRLTTQLTTLHLAATPTSAANLWRDGIKREHICITGNTVIDALHWAVDRKPAYDDAQLEAIDVGGRKVLLVTAHRRESWGEGMRQIGIALRTIAERYPELEIVFPIHKNPLVRDSIVPAVAGLANVTILEPLAYGAFSRIMNRATIVLTDSGGVQEEAPSLGKPVLVMRDTTERPEAVAAGTARLIGTDANRIVSAVTELLDDPAAFALMANAVNPYGDGLASQRTIEAMAHLFGLGQRPADFAG
jgi:UDP-N-acetylglucosamine 2-epimerase (non-hydrolysing)